MAERSMREVIVRHAPIALRPDQTVREACAAMRSHGIGAVLVTDAADRLLGIFTGRDAVCRMLAEARDPATTRLDQVMTGAPDALAPDCRAIDALRLMRDGGFRHVPVVEAGRVVGIVSAGDFRGREQARLEEESHLWERI